MPVLDTKRNPVDRLESVKRFSVRTRTLASSLSSQPPDSSALGEMDRSVLSGRAIFHSVASELRTLKSQIALVRYIVYNAIVSIPAQNRK